MSVLVDDVGHSHTEAHKTKASQWPAELPFSLTKTRKDYSHVALHFKDILLPFV